MKFGVDLTVTSHRAGRGAGPSWFDAYKAPDGEAPALVLDFANGVYGVGGVQQPLSSAMGFSRASTKAYTGAGGQIAYAASDEPAISRHPISGNIAGLLIEPARSNLNLWSEDFSNSVWSKSGITISSDAIAAPDGTLSADKFVEGGSSGLQRVVQTVSVVSGTLLTSSVFVKAAERNKVQLVFAGSGGYTQRIFNLSDGSLGPVATNGGAFSSVTAKIEPFADGWYRASMSAQTSGNSSVMVMYSLIDPSNANNYPSTAGFGAYFWGAQVEAFAEKSSYIKSEGTQGARAGDIADIALGAWFDPSQGSLVAQVSGDAKGYVAELSSSSSNRVAIGSTFLRNSGGSSQSAARSAGSSTCAISYNAAGSWSAAQSGALLSTSDAGAFSEGLTRLNIGHFLNGSTAEQQLGGAIKRLVYYPERLSDTALAQITQAV
ncbi:MAG: phage head spike fiber domain-containing protein [Paracoccaceae bacterium]